MSNIREVARIAGVSVATVSRALSAPEKVSDSSLKRVQEAIAQVDYKPNMLARNFRSARSYAVVVLVPDITNPFFAQVIQALEDRAQQKGYAVLLGDTRDSNKREDDYIDRVETRLADGVIQLRTCSSQKANVAHKDIPWVNACGVETTPGPSVRVDNVAATRAMVEYLVALGHRRIGLVSGLFDNAHSKERRRGFDQAIEAAGLSAEPLWIQEGDFTLWSGISAGESYASMSQRPTAIVCMSDQMAIGVIQALSSRGIRVPDDISVTGFDDIPYAQYGNPSLTTLSQPATAIGTTAMDMLLRIIAGESLQKTEIVLPTQLVIRQSTRKIRL
jgi:LacI family transcriptional regulator, repressor for deo operon, udp, cdd, tsx, nupC, and nupG